MRIKEVQAGVKLSKNYNSYQVNLVADLEGDENSENVGKDLIEKALKIVRESIEEGNVLMEDDSREVEVGAAWFSRISRDVLSVQYSKGGNWEDVAISDLEKTDGGYIQKIGEDIFVFRRIPDEKRRSNKMPVFRIYRVIEYER
ncbi:MAG: hypothetical protein V1888_02920 [archaeon]